ncbi:MAG TPA: type 1 glutamine amidotransferase domain-containing protein [Terriglobia bacterium]|nr:type 1 glutamine amidotransferase domain-containing protein [Terriglobia bacterium]
MKKALILAGDGFEDAELLYPYYRLKEEGFTVDVAGDESGKLFTGKKGYPIRATRAVQDVRIDDYAVLVVPGGHAPDKWRLDDRFVQIVRAAFQGDLVVAAICHAAQLLIEADVVKGRRMTCYASVKTDLRNAGAHYEDREVLVDGNLVTSRQPADLPAFMRETVRILRERQILPVGNSGTAPK